MIVETIILVLWLLRDDSVLLLARVNIDKPSIWEVATSTDTNVNKSVLQDAEY